MLRGLQLAQSHDFSRSTMAAAGFVIALPEEIRRQLLDHGRSRHFVKGELIQQRGDTGREFWYIQSGSVQIGRYSVDGKLNIFAVLGPGESFGEQAFLGEFPRMVDAIAASDTLLLRIGESELQAAIASDARVARVLLKAMAHMVQQAFDLVEAGRNLSTVERVVQALLRLCNDDGGHCTIDVTQQDLADLVGVSRVSLGKALKTLEAEGGVICGYGNVAVPDSLALQNRVGD